MRTGEFIQRVTANKVNNSVLLSTLLASGRKRGRHQIDDLLRLDRHGDLLFRLAVPRARREERAGRLLQRQAVGDAATDDAHGSGPKAEELEAKVKALRVKWPLLGRINFGTYHSTTQTVLL